jgi:RNA polymerase sigma-70 factor (ECF subfamily)
MADEAVRARAAADPAPGDDWSQLMARGQDGDEAAYRALLKGITPYLRALARRAGLPPDDCEDGVQDVLMTIHAIRHTYDPARPFTPWLVGVARNRLADKRRHRARTWARETELTVEHETFVAVETNGIEAADEARRLRDAVAGLPAGQRQAVELLKLKELSLKEASALSGQSETALKVAVHRAVKRLRLILGDESR